MKIIATINLDSMPLNLDTVPLVSGRFIPTEDGLYRPIFKDAIVWVMRRSGVTAFAWPAIVVGVARDSLSSNPSLTIQFFPLDPA